ncbi:MAG: hypothetical protein PHW24_02645 [Candidatus Moranbacteria bacterium]|nr:hypothetical protein [Candidatus Moranbacteria bacterium]
MTKLSEDILGKIKHDHIVPAARWRFLLKSYVFWGLLMVSVLLGSLSFSVIVHIIDFRDLNVFNQVHGNFFTSTVMLLPYFWFLSVMLFASVAYYNWKHTRLGYRFKRRWIVSGSIALSVLLGSVLYALGMGNQIDMLMSKNMPFYDKSKREARSELWMRPDNGLLVGKVVNVDPADDSITIKDETGQDWQIDEKNVQHEPQSVPKKGKIIKIVGKKEGDHTFAASEIRKCGNCQSDEEADSTDTKNAEKNGKDLDHDGDGE